MLTIFIPTYNRINSLKCTLDNFCKQIERFTLQNDVCILIGDNKSTDSTNKYLTELNCPFVKFYSNSYNLGITGNIIKGIKLTKSKYIWIFGDDDYVCKNFFPYIKILLKNKSELDLLLLNSTPFKEKKEIKKCQGELEHILLNNKIMLSNLNKIDDCCGFISSIIARTSLLSHYFNYYLSNKRLMSNSYLIKLVIYDIINSTDKAYYINNVFLWQRISERSYFTNSTTNLFKTYVLDLFEIFGYMKFEKKTMKLINKLYLKKAKITLFYCKLSGLKNKKIFETINILGYKQIFYILALFVLPRKLLLCLYWFYHHRKGTTDIYDQVTNLQK